MATDLDPQYSLLDDLDARQDDLLGQLDQLNQRIELLLGQFGSAPNHMASSTLAGQAETSDGANVRHSGSPPWAAGVSHGQEPS